MESKSEDGQAIFIRIAAPWITSSFSSKSLRILGNMAKISLHGLSISKKYDQVFRVKLWKVLQKYGVDGQLLRDIKLFYAKRRCVFGQMASNHSRFIVDVGLRLRCVLSLLLFIVCMTQLEILRSFAFIKLSVLKKFKITPLIINFVERRVHFCWKSNDKN